jgi:hypothetical protein
VQSSRGLLLTLTHSARLLLDGTDTASRGAVHYSFQISSQKLVFQWTSFKRFGPEREMTRRTGSTE